MRLAIVVGFLAKEHPHATDFLLAAAAAKRGHEVFFIDVGDLSCYPDCRVGGSARVVPPERCGSGEELREALLGPDARREQIATDALDVLWLRHNPSEFRLDERWMGPMGILFGEVALAQGTLVIDHPETLHFAEGKLYLQQFPETVRPKTLVTRSMPDVRAFYEEVGRRVVLKPVDGYGGADVFLVGEEGVNLGTIVESLSRRGYIMVQEFLPAASEGDVRLFVMNGEPLVVDGHYAAMRRVSKTGDFRSNMTAGGVSERAEITDVHLSLAAAVGPRLKADGMFLAGLDIVGDRIVEINTLSPGGLWSANHFEGVDFPAAVIEAVERKVERKRREPGVSNRELASWG